VRPRLSNLLSAPGQRLACAALVLACLTALLAPSAAGAATRGRPLGESSLGLPGPAGPFPDTIIHGRKRLARTLGSYGGETAFPVYGGQQVHISSTHYSDAQMQGVANVLGGLVHGEEMNTLSVYVASPDEIAYICGQGALACYAPKSSEMIVSGEDGSAYGVPRDYTIAHEYGHHIANNRVNAPWTAIDTGAKRWATYTRVCQGIRKGQLFPGDEDAHYWDNPGEAFAETNAHLDFPTVSVPWGYSEPLEPTQASIQKLRADILAPWTQPATVTWNGSLWVQRPNPALRSFQTPLDGMVDIQLTGPADANYNVIVFGKKLSDKKLRPRKRGRHHHRRHRHHRKRHPRRRVIDRAVSAGSSEHLQLQMCGQKSIQVEVRRRSGEGPFSVSVTRP